MHMADALVSPAVGGAMWATAAGLAAYSAQQLRKEATESKVPLMAVAGAFVFAAQMINFSIPGTGSSGHLGGGLLLTALLGPYAAFLVMCSILVVQALFFADGGLLALGCNICNLGFWTSFVAYPLIFKPLVGSQPSRRRLLIASLFAAIIGLQLGAFSVVMETTVSGITDLPFGKFLLLMQPIHLAIGVVEGIVTATLLAFVQQARPELLLPTTAQGLKTQGTLRPVTITLLVATVIVGAFLSWFAARSPDGLEWSISRTAGKEELATNSAIHKRLGKIQKHTAVLPDYNLPASEEAGSEIPGTTESWPAPSAGTSLSGIIGSGIVLGLAGLIGFALRPRQGKEFSGDRPGS